MRLSFLARSGLLLVLAGCEPRHPAPAPQPLPPPGNVVSDRAVILAASAATQAMDGCGRVGAGAVEEYWLPDEAVVREAELRLPAVLDSVLRRVAQANGYRETPRSRDYFRQYVGFVRGGKRLLYVNGVSRGFVNHIAAIAAERPGSTPSGWMDWTRVPLDACDGGSGFFGVVYDPGTGEFGRVEFNPSFGGTVDY